MPSLVRERLLTAAFVARAKHNSGAPVEDKARERDVIGRAVKLGLGMGIDPEVTLKVFTAQIEANKTAQRELLSRWSKLPPFGEVPDLAKEVRPTLDALTPKILAALKMKRYRPASDFALPFLPPVFGPAWKVAIRPLVQAGKGKP